MLLASANTAASNQLKKVIAALGSENLSWPPTLVSWLLWRTASRTGDSTSETSSEKYGVPAILSATTSGASILALKSDEGRIAVVPRGSSSPRKTTFGPLNLATSSADTPWGAISPSCSA